MSAYNVGDLGSIPGSGRSSGEGNGSTPVLLPEKSHGRRSPVSYSPWGCKESDTTEPLHFTLFHFLVNYNLTTTLLQWHMQLVFIILLLQMACTNIEIR